ncbi:hypothetical protein ACOMHN_019490 [Nucella lapillus]
MENKPRPTWKTRKMCDRANGPHCLNITYLLFPGKNELHVNVVVYEGIARNHYRIWSAPSFLRNGQWHSQLVNISHIIDGENTRISIDEVQNFTIEIEGSRQNTDSHSANCIQSLEYVQQPCSSYSTTTTTTTPTTTTPKTTTTTTTTLATTFIVSTTDASVSSVKEDDEEEDDDDFDSSFPFIVGGVATTVVIVVVCVIIYCCRKRRSRKGREPGSSINNNNDNSSSLLTGVAPASSRARAPEDRPPHSSSSSPPDEVHYSTVDSSFISTTTVPPTHHSHSRPAATNRGQKEEDYNHLGITRRPPEANVTKGSVDGGDGGGKLYDRLHADPSVYSQIDRNRKPEVVKDATYSHIP